MTLPDYILYKDQATQALTTSFALINFVDQISSKAFQSTAIIVSNDESAAANEVHFSFDGTNTHGKIKGGETLTFDRASKTKIYVKGSSAGYSYRLWVW